MERHFVSERLEAEPGAFDPGPMARGEPALPPAFSWRGDRLVVGRVTRVWRSTKDDRGDTYLKRHWFEIETGDGRIAVIYFERHPRRNESRWWLYTIGG